MKDIEKAAQDYYKRKNEWIEEMAASDDGLAVVALLQKHVSAGRCAGMSYYQKAVVFDGVKELVVHPWRMWRDGGSPSGDRPDHHHSIVTFHKTNTGYKLVLTQGVYDVDFALGRVSNDLDGWGRMNRVKRSIQDELQDRQAEVTKVYDMSGNKAQSYEEIKQFFSTPSSRYLVASVTCGKCFALFLIDIDNLSMSKVLTKWGRAVVESVSVSYSEVDGISIEVRGEELTPIPGGYFDYWRKEFIKKANVNLKDLSSDWYWK